MKQNLTELVFILDRSGSMSGLESDTIGGFNGLLDRQRHEPGDALITTVLFDDKYELLHDRINIRGVAPMTRADYYVRGRTALMDAVGMTVAKISAAQQHTVESERPARTLIVITTDGMENASREFNRAKVKALIERMKREHGWEFIFLGANIDSVMAAGELGISAEYAANYHADHQGTAANFDAVASAVSSVRQCGVVGRAWRKAVDEDFRGRG